MGHLFFYHQPQMSQTPPLTLIPPSNATASGNTVVWIMEAPDGGIPTSSLPAFDPVTFSSMLVYDAQGGTGNAIGPGSNTFNIRNNGKVLTSVTLTGTSAFDTTCTISYLP